MVAHQSRVPLRHSGDVHHQALVPRLEDDLVVLDAHRAGDVAVQVAGEDEETARRFGWWPRQSTPATVIRAYQEWADDWVQGRARRTFAVRDRLNERLVGGCELRIQADGGTAHVSYWTNAADRRRGYASHALILLSDYARGLGLTRLESHLSEDNTASARVSERAGFNLVGTFAGEDGQVMLSYTRSLSLTRPRQLSSPTDHSA